MRRTHIHPSKDLAQFVVNHLCARTDLDEVMFVVGTTQGLGSVQWQLTAEVDGKRDVRLVRAYGVRFCCVMDPPCIYSLDSTGHALLPLLQDQENGPDLVGSIGTSGLRPR